MKPTRHIFLSGMLDGPGLRQRCPGQVLESEAATFVKEKSDGEASDA